MWCILLASLLSAAAACFSHDSFPQEHWKFCQELETGMTMYFGPSADGDFMQLGLHVESHTGWSALAVGGNGGMKGAQQFVVRQEGNAWIAEERYSTDYVKPHLQETQEIQLIFAQEVNGSTSWGVLLPMRSCLPGDRYAMEEVGMFMHWALGYSHDFAFHKRRGQFHTNLVGGPPGPPPDVSSFASASITMQNVSVQAEGDSDPKNPYICGVFDIAEVLPATLNASEKHHVAVFSPILDPNSIQYVHHMILYECSNEAAATNNLTHNQVLNNCERMITGCQSSVWPWAVGGEDLVLPDDVGITVANGARFYILQVHYYNPGLTTGVFDSSGVRMSLAPALRTHDASTFGIFGGVMPQHRDPLPPGVADLVISSAVVPSACTQWDVEEITVLGVQHHAHLVGKRLKVEVTRDGEYIGEMRREKVYDFNHQSSEESSVKKLKRGDELTLTCSYDTSSKTTPTNFGDFTQDEMCLAYFLHYPAQSPRRAIFMSANGNQRVTICPDAMPAGGAQFGFDGTPQFGQSQILSLAKVSTAPTLTPPSCTAVGKVQSSAANQVLLSLGYGTDMQNMAHQTSALSVFALLLLWQSS